MKDKATKGGAPKISRRRARIAAFGAVFAVLSEGAGAKGAKGAKGEKASAAAMVQKRRESTTDKAELAALDDDLTVGIAAAFDGRRGEIEKLLSAALRRPPALISTAERAVICAAAAEVLAYPEIAHKIVINEAVDIAKQYGGESGYKLVNAALDNICRAIRG